MLHTTVSELPLTIKRWVGKRLNRPLRAKDHVSITVYDPKPDIPYSQILDDMEKAQQRRLKAVARRMRKAGMSEKDITCVVRRGKKEGESFYKNIKAYEESLAAGKKD